MATSDARLSVGAVVKLLLARAAHARQAVVAVLVNDGPAFRITLRSTRCAGTQRLGAVRQLPIMRGEGKFSVATNTDTDK